MNCCLSQITRVRFAPNCRPPSIPPAIAKWSALVETERLLVGQKKAVAIAVREWLRPRPPIGWHIGMAG
jgi:hypothetical protein